MSKSVKISELRAALQRSTANELALSQALKAAENARDTVAVKLNASMEAQKRAESERDANRDKIEKLKRLLHESELEAARLGGVVGRMREQEVSAALPVVETTQKTTSREVDRGTALYGARVVADAVDYGSGYGRRDEKHWTAL